MATTEIANRFGRLIREVSWVFNLATTDNEQAKHLETYWPTVANILCPEKDFIAIRDEIVCNYSGDQDNWNYYVYMLDNVLLKDASRLDRQCQQYLNETPPPGWLIHGEDDASELERNASCISGDMQRLLAIVWREISRNPLPVACRLKVKKDEPVVGLSQGETGITLEHRQIALLYSYRGLTIDDDNKNEIAKKYNQTSGQRLFAKYKTVKSRERIQSHKNESKRVRSALIEDIEHILVHLTDKQLIDAKEDIEIVREESL